MTKVLKYKSAIGADETTVDVTITEQSHRKDEFGDNCDHFDYTVDGTKYHLYSSMSPAMGTTNPTRFYVLGDTANDHKVIKIPFEKFPAFKRIVKAYNQNDFPVKETGDLILNGSTVKGTYKGREIVAVKNDGCVCCVVPEKDQDTVCSGICHLGAGFSWKYADSKPGLAISEDQNSGTLDGKKIVAVSSPSRRCEGCALDKGVMGKTCYDETGKCTERTRKDGRIIIWKFAEDILLHTHMELKAAAEKFFEEFEQRMTLVEGTDLCRAYNELKRVSRL